MQITARKQRFSPMNIKYAAAALGIAGALAAGVITYTVTRDDSQASQSVASAPTLRSHYVEQAGEGALSGNSAVTSSRDYPIPTHREGFQATGPGDDVTSSSPKMRGVPGVTTRDEPTTYLADGMREGFIAGTDSDGLSYLAPEERSSSGGMLYEEYTQQNPGSGSQTQSAQRHSTPALANW